MPDIEQAVTTILAEDEQPAVVTIYQPDGEPYRAADGSDATMSILGGEAKVVRQAQDRAVRRFARSRRGSNEVEIARQNRIETATAAIVAWHGWETNGQPAPLTPENVGRVLQLQHILEQVEAVLREHARFFKPTSPS